jgi:hypothetical protein
MNRILHTVAVTLLAASASAAVAQVKWLKPEEVSRTSEGEVLYYFHRENVALCREVEEDVLSDTRIVEAVLPLPPRLGRRHEGRQPPDGHLPRREHRAHHGHHQER